MKIKKKIILTGSSGFIGFHVSKQLLDAGYKVVGIDNINNYYSTKLKKKITLILKKKKNFKFYRFDLSNKKKTFSLLKKIKPNMIIHLAAQPGVRYSFINPHMYVSTNIYGFLNILEGMRILKLKNIIYASSSSVYGNSKSFPTKETQQLKPENFYGLTKVFNEKNAELYSKYFKLNCIGLRFFTVYGSLGRPDMLIPKLINKIKYKKKIDIYNKGKHHRDFTYVEDVAKIIYKLVKKFPKSTKHKIYNVCSGKVVSIKKVILGIEKILKKSSNHRYLSLQKGDMLKTHGENKLLKKATNFNDFTKIETGLLKSIILDKIK